MRIWGGDSPRPPPFTYHGGSDPLSRTFRGRPLLGQIFLSWLRHQRHFPWRFQAGQAFSYSTERDRGLQRGARHLRVRPAAALRAGHGGEAGPAGVPGRLGRGRGAGTAGGASPGCKKTTTNGGCVPVSCSRAVSTQTRITLQVFFWCRVPNTQSLGHDLFLAQTPYPPRGEHKSDRAPSHLWSILP